MRRVVITGMGALTPIGNSLTEFWKNSLNGMNGVAPITHFDSAAFKTKFACEVKGFDPETVVERKDVRKYDKFTLYALKVAEEALQHAHLDLETVNKDRVGVIWGSGNGGFETFQQQVTEFALGDGTPRFNPFFIPKILTDIASGVISIRYGFKGPNFTTISACASSTTAIIDSFNQIKWGKADVVLTGGSEAAIVEASIGGFGALKALSTRNEDFSIASRPFDVERDGFVMGEGAGALVLESYEHAVQRGATILAEIVGGGMAADAYHLTGTHPQGDGAVLGMKAALEEAGVRPEEINHVNAHATSTGLGDASELIALQRLFGSGHSMHVSATKSMTGHLLGAAGAIEGILAALSCQYDCVPPTINTQKIDSDFEGKINITLGQKVEKKVNYALSNTFGFGGHVASVLFKKFEH